MLSGYNSVQASDKENVFASIHNVLAHRDDSFAVTVALLAKIHNDEVGCLKVEIDRLSGFLQARVDTDDSFGPKVSPSADPLRPCLNSPQRIAHLDAPFECPEAIAPQFPQFPQFPLQGMNDTVGRVGIFSELPPQGMLRLASPTGSSNGHNEVSTDAQGLAPISEISFHDVDPPLQVAPSPTLEASTFELLKTPKRTSAALFKEDLDEPKLTRQLIGMQAIPSGIQQPTTADKRRNLGVCMRAIVTVMDTVVAVTIVMNAIAIGFQTDDMARSLSDDSPDIYNRLEMFFCLVFSTELSFRLATHRAAFFTMRGRHWNIFDGLLVLFQWVDVLGLMIHEVNVTFLRLFRVLRLLRVLRVVRLLQFLGQLTVVTDAIYNSLLDLMTTGAILLLIVYCAGVVFTHAVSNHRMTMKDTGDEEDANLVYWWGTLTRSMLSLLESVLDGADWDNAVSPLMEFSYTLGLLYLAYIAFAMLAMLNVITGIFVQSALRNAEKSKDAFFIAHVKQLFHMLDQDYNGQISKKQYMGSMDSQELQRHMEEIDIDPREAKLLFNYIDSDNSNTISAEELLAGLVRLRAGAKFMDLMSLMHEVELQHVRWSKWCSRIEVMLVETVNLMKGHMTVNSGARVPSKLPVSQDTRFPSKQL